jgi:YidC/Oxa1 family membrane protein insertase
MGFGAAVTSRCVASAAAARPVAGDSTPFPVEERPVILASSIGEIAHPFFITFAWLIAAFYALIPNYAIAIALLTIVVMIVVFPITRRATRSMMKMQLLAPELKKIQTRYKTNPSMTAAEKQEARQHLNEEMMALYRENGVSPTGGCLPMLLQLPIFWILYGTIRGLIHTKNFASVAAARAYCHGLNDNKLCPQPLYIDRHSKLYRAVEHAHGHLNAFGINLADSVRTAGLSWGSKVPLIALILLAIGLQYIQIKQVSGRNKAAAAANPQMQQMQRIMPIIFAVIYIAIPAGVNVYFIVSSLFRIGQQEFMYRRDPHIRESMAQLHARAKSEPKVVDTRAKEARPKRFLERLLPAAALEPEARPPSAAPEAAPPARPAANASGNGRGAIPPGGRGPGGSPARGQSRSRNKRPRRQR